MPFAEKNVAEKLEASIQVFGVFFQLINEKKQKNGRILSIESWLFNEDPYNGLLMFIVIPK